MSEIRLHTIKPARGARKTRRLVGRGPGSGLGKTGGRGTKGQRARSGGKSGLKLKGLKRIVLRIPKNRGFKTRTPHPETVTLTQLDAWFATGATVDVAMLKKQSRISNKARGAKIVNSGSISKAIKLVGIEATPAAKAAIEKAGGSLA
jgi:large subunit ribosomal protein L15